MNQNIFKKVDKQLTKGLLDLIVLGMLKKKSMHGYGIISNIRKKFGIYFGPSTVYPFLKNMEEKGYIKSVWDMKHDRPRKVFSLTHQGNDILTGTEQSFRGICIQLNQIGIKGILPKLNQINNTMI
jgi:DNA-binding PadR family transcriptional regulator